MIAIYNPNQNLFMSPMVDGPIQYSGSLTNAGGADGAGATGASVVHMTKFGRSFSIVRIPYCLKLLMQELLVMNVQMRIITEDNIDQLPSMSYSNNVYKVLKDGKGAMGVDDIIERNRLAAGLKPRDMTARNKSVGAPSLAGEEDEEEAAIGSRVYLPSRSEQEEEYDTRPSAGIIPAGAKGAFDPDVHPEEIILDLDIDTRQNIRNLGWRFALKADIARQMRGKGAGAAAVPPLSVSDITGEDLVLESVIMDKNGEPTERWTISGRQWVGDYPTRFPDGWLSEMLVYPDDTPISPSDMVEEMRKTRKPLNWVLAIIVLIEKHGRRKMTSELESVNAEIAENVRNIETNTNETERVSGEIGRAKREGNVAEEERLKVQMTRLMDERVKLDAIRREMESRMTHEPKTPEYTSSTPLAGVGAEAESEASRVRGAVASFNEKMLDKYGDNDENIPESGGEYTPRTPRSPEYTSMYSGGGTQRGGGGATNRFIPQIPTGVLESYLSSRYGQAAATSANASAAYTGGGGGMMTGGGGMTLPTMNIPIVATMPMAGMMPIQQQQQQTGGAPLQQQVPGTTASQAPGLAQTAGGVAPGADGVKTLSIKL
jgi:hypothetical protein